MNKIALRRTKHLSTAQLGALKSAALYHILLLVHNFSLSKKLYLCVGNIELRHG